MGQVGSTGIYYTPPVPGGIMGQSMALAYAKGARTPAEIASQGFHFYLLQAIAMLVVVGIIVLAVHIFKPKSNFIPGPIERDTHTKV